MLHVEVIVYCRWFGHIPALAYLHMFDSFEFKRRVRFRSGKCCMCDVIFCWLKFDHILAWVVLASVRLATAVWRPSINEDRAGFVRYAVLVCFESL